MQATKYETTRVKRALGTILVIEDEPMVRDITRSALNRRGFTVYTANDGLEGFSAFQTHESEIDAVVVDYSMPKLDGREVCERIRKIRPDLPILLTSGLLLDDPALKGISATTVLHKPYDIATLNDKVQCILDQR